jgi:hypothetical protein
MTSRVPGDDDLPWPKERLRYPWSIPHLPEKEWPREEMPEEVARLLGGRLCGSGSATPRTEPVPGWRARRSPCG